MVGIFFIGFFLGSINYDLNPRDEKREYKVEIAINEHTNISVYNPTHQTGIFTLHTGVMLNISGLNKSANYLCSHVAFGDFDKSIDGVSFAFTNRTSIGITLEMKRTNVILFQNKTTTLLWLLEIWVYEEITPVDIINALPTLADFNLFATLIGVVMGVVGSYISMKYRKYIGEQLTKIKNYGKKKT